MSDEPSVNSLAKTLRLFRPLGFLELQQLVVSRITTMLRANKIHYITCRMLYQIALSEDQLLDDHH